MRIILFANQGLGDLILMSPSIYGLISELGEKIVKFTVVIKSLTELEYLRGQSYFNRIEVIIFNTYNFRLFNVISIFIKIKFGRDYDYCLAPIVSQKLANKYFFKFLYAKKIYTKCNFNFKRHSQIAWERERYHQADFINRFLSMVFCVDLKRYLTRQSIPLLSIDSNEILNIGVGPGCGKAEAFKVVPPNLIADAIDRFARQNNLKLRIVLFGTKNDSDALNYLACKLAAFPINILLNKDCKTIVTALNSCAITIVGHSGPGHIASISNTRLLCVSGPTNPTESGPRTPYIRHVRLRKYNCAPCYREDFSFGCQKVMCMESIAVEELVLGMEELMHNNFCDINISTKQSNFPILAE